MASKMVCPLRLIAYSIFKDKAGTFKMDAYSLEVKCIGEDCAWHVMCSNLSTVGRR